MKKNATRIELRIPAALSSILIGLSLNVQVQAQTLEEVVVTAQRRTENIQDVPISVVVIDQQTLSRSQVNSLTDLPQIAPSLNFENRSVGTALNFSMRGVGAFAPNVGIQPGVGLVVDEVPYSRNAEYDVDLGDISNVQFLNGPQGTLFGANNIGGVVLISTADPTDEFDGYVEGTVTNDGEYILRAVASGPLSDRVRGRALLYTKDREGYINNLYPLADLSGAGRRGAEESNGARVKLDVDLASSLSLQLIGDYRDSYTTEVAQYTDFGPPTSPAFVELQGNGDAALGNEVANDPKLINTDLASYNLTETWGASANLNWELSDTLSLRSITAYRQLDLFGQVDIDASPATVADPQGASLVIGTRSNRGIYAADDGKVNVPCGCTGLENIKQELRLQYTSESLDAVVGAYYLNEENGDPDDIPVGGTGGIPLLRNGAILLFVNLSDIETTLDSWAVFGDVTWHVNDRLDIFAGYRWNDETLDLSFYNRSLIVPPGFFTVEDDTVIVDPAFTGSVTAFDAEHGTEEWAGRAGFMWAMTPDINLYGSVARGFTGAGVVSTATSPDNAFVEPTTALSYEVGAKSMLMDNRVRLNVALFRNDLESIQSSLFDPATVQTILVNAGDFTSQGFELDLSALVGDSWTLNAVATIMDTELTSDVFEPCYFQQTVAEGCVDTGGGVFAQNINGKPGINAPDLKWTARTTYNLPLPSKSYEAFATLAYTWTDERYYELIYDPIGSLAPSYGTLDLTVGLSDKNGRYDITLFGKNILDEEFVVFSQSDVGRNARVRSTYSRSSFAYWGLKARFNF